MASDFPDIHNNMSKKIAQLTKVIFFLNTRCDDNDSIIQNIMSCYEQEMNNIVDSTNSIIQKFKSANDSQAKMKEIEKAYEDFREITENERIKASMEFDRFKKALEEKERDIKSVNEKKLSSYEQEVSLLKNKLENLQRAVSNLSESNGQKEAHQKELGDYVKKQNEK